jgi:hypothetical protein
LWGAPERCSTWLGFGLESNRLDRKNLPWTDDHSSLFCLFVNDEEIESFVTWTTVVNVINTFFINDVDAK